MAKRTFEVGRRDEPALTLSEEEAHELSALLEFAIRHRPLDTRSVRVNGTMLRVARFG